MAQTKLNRLIQEASAKLYEHVSDTESLSQWKKQMFTFITEIAELKLFPSPCQSQENSSLDPVDWVSARFMAHQMLDSSLDHIQFIRDRPVRQSIPYDIHMALRGEALPENGQLLSHVCRDVLNYVIPYSKGNAHPRFWDAVSGEGTLVGILGDMIAAALNVNIVASNHSPALVEMTVIDWMCTAFGFPKETSGGVVTSGTSISTVIAIATARHRALIDVKEKGLFNTHRLIVYASTETHQCVARSLELLGLGFESLHLIPVDQDFRISIPQLKSAIQTDRQRKLIPFCIIGNAG